MALYRTPSRRWVKRRPRTNESDVEKDLELEAKRWQELAPKLGWCGACGVSVDEEHGRLHAFDCPYLPAERRRPA